MMNFAAEASVETPKAVRFMKALCNHFGHKVTAEYTEQQGTVQFGFGHCEMNADENALSFHIAADTEENFNRVKSVIASHLERFSGEDALQVQWVDRVNSF